MKQKEIFKRIMAMGIPLYPLFVGISYHALLTLFPKSNDNLSLSFLCGLIPVALIALSDAERPKEDDILTGRRAAYHKAPPSELLFNEPTGIIFGKYKDKYVCKRTDIDGHILCVGGSGSGKSSCLVIPSLLSSGVTTLALDIKGELSAKTALRDDKNICIFNPQDRHTYGYNPFYALNEHSTEQQILETMQTIAFSLIPRPANLDNTFWVDSARNLFIGLQIYFYKAGKTSFIDVIDAILSAPIKETIANALSSSAPTSNEYRNLIQFESIADETISGIISELNNRISFFSSDEDIKYAFKYNPYRISPWTIMEGKSVFLTLAEHKLSAYSNLLSLILNQCLAELEKRPEDSSPLFFIVDELPRILSSGKIEHLLDAARTLRSRKVTLMLITQSIEALETAYSKPEVLDLISNCSYKLILSASSKDTQETVISWAGKYHAKKRSHNGSWDKYNITTSFDDKDVLETSDLITIQNRGEAVLISPYGFSLVEKTPYYKEPIWRDKSESIQQHNKAIEGL